MKTPPRTTQKNKPTAIDNRMAWIRNVEAVGSKNDTYTAEHEFVTECHIPGILDYENGKILCGILVGSEELRGRLERYCLKIRYPLGDGSYNDKASKSGYYFKEGIAGELLSLFSLYFQCRFFPSATYSGELTSHGLKIRTEHRYRHESVHPSIHPKVLKNNGNRNFARGLGDFLDRVRSLDADTHERFILACWHYARALREIAIDSEMVFIRLVSAVEILAEKLALPAHENPLAGAEYEAIIIRNQLSDAQYKQLTKLLLVDKDGKIRVRRSKASFVNFINTYSIGCLRGGNWKAKHLKIKRVDIPKAVGRIYDARSAYLHAGEPMYLSQFMRDMRGWDTDPSIGRIADNKRFPRAKKLPYTYWFEDLVRCCLLNYLEAHASI